MIIFLNGCSSAGKSTIARSIQHLSPTPWLHLGIDAFLNMMPAKYVEFGAKADQGFHFIQEQDEEGPIMRIESGPFGNAVCRSIPRVVKSLADDGHHLIMDEVLFGNEMLHDYAQTLHNHTVYFIGVLCDLKTLEEREILRGDRAWGLGRDQITRVHSPSRPYDLTVDTSHQSGFDCAHEILKYIEITPTPQGFKSMLPTTVIFQDKSS